MKTYTVVAGVNGCGKSSLTGVLRTDTVMNRFGKRFEDLLHSIVLAVSFAALVVLVLTSKKYKPESEIFQWPALKK